MKSVIRDDHHDGHAGEVQSAADGAHAIRNAFRGAIGAGLRKAFVLAPTEHAAQRLAGALHATTVMASPITTALSARWIVDSTAMAVLDTVRAESVARLALVTKHLGKFGLMPTVSVTSWCCRSTMSP